MNTKTKRAIVMAVLIVGVAMTLIGAVASITDPVYLGATIVLFVIAIALQVKFYRCPHCNRYLGKMYYMEAFCPRCHKVLNPELVPAKSSKPKNTNRQHKKKK